MSDNFRLIFYLFDQLQKIRKPVLIIHGQWDPSPNETIEKMHKAIDGSEMHIIENCGHFVHIEKQEEYFRLLRVFLDRYKQ
ncbi:MAG: alpha/beta fold hydrolase [Bacillota bacterium]